MARKMYLLNLAGGSGDLACSSCLKEAKRERADQIVGVALCGTSPGEVCGWCGWEPSA